jgi:hypothetical protein
MTKATVSVAFRPFGATGAFARAAGTQIRIGMMM